MADLKPVLVRCKEDAPDANASTLSSSMGRQFDVRRGYQLEEWDSGIHVFRKRHVLIPWANVAGVEYEEEVETKAEPPPEPPPEEKPKPRGNRMPIPGPGRGHKKPKPQPEA